MKVFRGSMGLLWQLLSLRSLTLLLPWRPACRQVRLIAGICELRFPTYLLSNLFLMLFLKGILKVCIPSI